MKKVDNDVRLTETFDQSWPWTRRHPGKIEQDPYQVRGQAKMSIEVVGSKLDHNQVKKKKQTNHHKECDHDSNNKNLGVSWSPPAPINNI